MLGLIAASRRRVGKPSLRLRRGSFRNILRCSSGGGARDGRGTSSPQGGREGAPGRGRARVVSIGGVQLKARTDGHPALVPSGYLPPDLDVLPTDTLRHLQWMMQKAALGQDMCLLGAPGPQRRWLSLMFCELLGREVEYLSLSGDTTEADLKQRREVTNGCSTFTDQAPVRAAINGRVLVLEYLEKAERNVLPTLNNLLQNREMQLDDGRFLLQASTFDALRQEGPQEGVAVEGTLSRADAIQALTDRGMVRVDPDFTVIALGSPVPPYEGMPLDPPLRSRFQARICRSLPPGDLLQALKYAAPGVDVPRLSHMVQLSQMAAPDGQGQWALGGVARVLEAFPHMSLREALRGVYPPLQSVASDASGKGGGSGTSQDVEKLLREVEGGPSAVGDTAATQPNTRRGEYLLQRVEVQSQGGGEARGEALLSTPSEGVLSPAAVATATVHFGEGEHAVAVDIPIVKQQQQQQQQQQQHHQQLLIQEQERQQQSPTSTASTSPTPTPSPTTGTTTTTTTSTTSSSISSSSRMGSSNLTDGGNIWPFQELVMHRELITALLRTAGMLPAPPHHIGLVGPKGGGKTALLHHLCSLVGSPPCSTFVCFKDLLARDLLMRRTSRGGSTAWEMTPLTKSAIAGHWCILDGFDRLSPDASATLARLLQDGEVELPDGSKLVTPSTARRVRDAQQEGDGSGWEAQGRVDEPRLHVVHPAFRCFATAQGAGEPQVASAAAPSGARVSSPAWVNAAAGLFRWHALRPLELGEMEELLGRMFPSLASLASCRDGNHRPQLTQLMSFASSLREEVAAGAVDTREEASALALSLRQMVRICRQMAAATASHDHPSPAPAVSLTAAGIFDLHGTVHRTLMSGLLPLRDQDVIERCLCKAGIAPPPPPPPPPQQLLVQQQQHSLVTQDGGWLRIGNVTLPQRTPVRPELVPRPVFFDNASQTQQLATLASMHASGERALLLIGNQGVGKNVLVDRLLQLLRAEREYMQLHRDSTVASLTASPHLTTEGLVWLDSPLVKAARLGRVLVLDEVDKAPLEVVCLLKHLAEDGEMALADGRTLVSVSGGKGPGTIPYTNDDNNTIPIHPDFRLWVLANRPGYPFHGNHFFQQSGDVFAAFLIQNPDLQSELQVLREYAPDVPAPLLLKLATCFSELRELNRRGVLTYPYSIREGCSVVKHLQRFPADGVVKALQNVLAFDAFDEQLQGTLSEVFQQQGIPLLPVSSLEGAGQEQEHRLSVSLASPICLSNGEERSPTAPRTTEEWLVNPAASPALSASFALPHFSADRGFGRAWQRQVAEASPKVTGRAASTIQYCRGADFSERLGVVNPMMGGSSSRGGTPLAIVALPSQQPSLYQASTPPLASETGSSSSSTTTTTTLSPTLDSMDVLRHQSLHVLRYGQRGELELQSLLLPPSPPPSTAIPFTGGPPSTTPSTAISALGSAREAVLLELVSAEDAAYGYYMGTGQQGTQAPLMAPLPSLGKVAVMALLPTGGGKRSLSIVDPRGRDPIVSVSLPMDLDIDMTDFFDVDITDVDFHSSDGMPQRGIDSSGRRRREKTTKRKKKARTGLLSHFMGGGGGGQDEEGHSNGLLVLKEWSPPGASSSGGSSSDGLVVFEKGSSEVYLLEVTQTHDDDDDDEEDGSRMVVRAKCMHLGADTSVQEVGFEVQQQQQQLVTQQQQEHCMGQGPGQGQGQSEGRGRGGSKGPQTMWVRTGDGSILRVSLEKREEGGNAEEESRLLSNKNMRLVRPAERGAAKWVQTGEGVGSSVGKGKGEDSWGLPYNEMLNRAPRALFAETLTANVLPQHCVGQGQRQEEESLLEGEEGGGERGGGVVSVTVWPRGQGTHVGDTAAGGEGAQQGEVGTVRKRTAFLCAESPTAQGGGGADSQDLAQGSSRRGRRRKRTGGGVMVSALSGSSRVSTPPAQHDRKSRGHHQHGKKEVERTWLEVVSMSHDGGSSSSSTGSPTGSPDEQQRQQQQQQDEEEEEELRVRQVLLQSGRGSVVDMCRLGGGGAGGGGVGHPLSGQGEEGGGGGLVLATLQEDGTVTLWQVDKAQLGRELQDWRGMLGAGGGGGGGGSGGVGVGGGLDDDRLTIRDGKDEAYQGPRTGLGDAKHGKEDPNNAPHVGGNTWAGGTGGSDTAGLGGRGGPYRLDKGHHVHQISDEDKAQVSEAALARAREMAAEGLEKRLREIGMGKGDFERYQRVRRKVAGEVGQIRALLESLKADTRPENQRVWLRNQSSGELDDAKLIEGLVGERSIYKRRGVAHTHTDPFSPSGDDDGDGGGDGSKRPRSRPRRLRFVVDVSGSMYRFNGQDGRLERLLECMVMVMEGFRGHESRFTYDIVGHSGDSAEIPFVIGTGPPPGTGTGTTAPPGTTTVPPEDERAQLSVLEAMVAHSQYCRSGDNTLEATRKALQWAEDRGQGGGGGGGGGGEEEEEEDAFVFVITDANLERYGIKPARLGALLTGSSHAKAHVIMIASFGDEAARAAASMPLGRGHVCLDTEDLPRLLQGTFSTSILHK